MNKIELNSESVAAYKELMTNPKDHGLEIPSLSECIESCDISTPRHILYEQYVDLINKPLPKVFFYIIMDELYTASIAKADNGDMGYKLKFRQHSPSKTVKE